MLIATLSEIPGYRIAEAHGMVRGSTIRARHIGSDIFARFRGILGGEVHEYSKLMGEAREQAIDRMIEEARSLGANAVVCVRFQTMEVMTGASEVLCYGTAVRLEGESDA